MNFELSDEQRFLREAAQNALGRQDTISAAREGRDGADPLDLWHVAREAGWSGLLVPEEHGGAGLGAFDAMLVMEECGRRLASAGLLGHLPATLVLSRAAEAGDERAVEAVAELASGERRAAMVHARPPVGDEGWTVDALGSQDTRAPVPTARGGSLTGAAGYQPDAANADWLVVPAVRADGELVVGIIDAHAKGVEVESLVRGDASRPIANVTLEDAPADLVEVEVDAIAEAWYLVQALLATDSLGVCEAVLEMAVAYAKDRHAFARPIGSFQSIKHQLVEILRRIERLRSLSYYAGYTFEARPQEIGLAASCARFAAEEGVNYSTRTCIAVHGGIGATWEHDAPYFWRRSQLSRLLLGGEADAADRVAAEIIAGAGRLEAIA